MLPITISQVSPNRMIVFIIGLALLLAMIGCGGGGGGGELTHVKISGTVDDGTENSPISNAVCAFYDMNDVLDRKTPTTANTNGDFSILLLPDKEGYIRCYPPDIEKLALSRFFSTRDRKAGDVISGEHVTPKTTALANIIRSENPPDPKFRSDQLDVEKNAYLELITLVSTRLHKYMLNKGINVDFGGGEGGGDGGGVGGDGGTGGDASPIPNARCEFTVSNDLKAGEVLYSAAISDFLQEGKVNRPDLNAIKEQINAEFKGREEEIKNAFAEYFPNVKGIGEPYIDTADENGTYFIEVPPGVPGFVRCFPPDQENLILATYVPERTAGSDLTGQDIDPATTFFSHHIAKNISGDLGEAKENFLNDKAGLGLVHIESDGETITGFQLPSDSDPANANIGLVAFSSTSLFNILYKNGTNVDFLTIMDKFIENKTVDPESLQEMGVPVENATAWSQITNTANLDAGTALETSLEEALSTAHLNVLIAETTDGRGVPGATVELIDLGNDLICDNCDSSYYPRNILSAENGEATFDLSNVPSQATQINLLVSGVSGYTEMSATAQVIASASVYVDIVLTPGFHLTVQRAGDGFGIVTSVPEGINCSIDAASQSGTCDETFEGDTLVTLTAIADETSIFNGWEGYCSGVSSTCTVTMDQAHTVAAIFAQARVISSLTIDGPSSVNEGESEQYTATATWSDGTTSNVTSNCTWSENSSYSTITSSGMLTALSVTTNQSVTVSASYSYLGATVSDTHGVTIADVLRTIRVTYPNGGESVRFCGTGCPINIRWTSSNIPSDVPIHISLWTGPTPGYTGTGISGASGISPTTNDGLFTFYLNCGSGWDSLNDYYTVEICADIDKDGLDGNYFNRGDDICDISDNYFQLIQDLSCF